MLTLTQYNVHVFAPFILISVQDDPPRPVLLHLEGNLDLISINRCHSFRITWREVDYLSVDLILLQRSTTV